FFVRSITTGGYIKPPPISLCSLPSLALTSASLFRVLRRKCEATLARYASSGSKNDGKLFSSAVASPVAEPASYVLSLPTPCRVPFGHPLPDLPTVKFSKKPPELELYKTNVTLLENGVTIASEPAFGEFCTIGAVVNAGSRYEAKFPKGISHFLEKLAFTPSKKFKNSDEITQIMEKNGAIVDCQHTKDSLIYASSCRASSAEAVLELIAESLFQPNFGEAEIATAREVVKSNVEAISMKPEPEELLNDLIHAAAYRDNTLGLPKYCQLENVDKIDKADLFSFMRTYYTPNRIIIGGVGISHEALVNASKVLFERPSPTWVSEEKIQVDESLAQYTGGEIRIEKDLSNVGMAINPFPELGHFVIGFESCKFTDEDFVPFCVLNSLMGGGGSFSAGGPGKGMYTRYHWIYNATSVNLGYADSGIFFIRASTHPKNLGDLDELERAKTQLKSSLLMNLEQRPVRFEDLTRQILGQGMRKSPLEYVDAIGEVCAADIDRVVNRLLSTRVSIVGYGTLKKLPSCDKVDRVIAKRDLSFLKSPSYFFISKDQDQLCKVPENHLLQRELEFSVYASCQFISPFYELQMRPSLQALIGLLVRIPLSTGLVGHLSFTCFDASRVRSFLYALKVLGIFSRSFGILPEPIANTVWQKVDDEEDSWPPFAVMNWLLLLIPFQLFIAIFGGENGTLIYKHFTFTATSDGCFFAVFEPRTDNVLLESNKSFVVRLNKPSPEPYTVHLNVEYPDVLLLENSYVHIAANSTEPHRVRYHAARLKSSVYIAENRTSKWNECASAESLEENFILISVYRLDILNLISSILGWVYFAAWTISFWPQIVLNVRRKSVVGLNFDFLALNATGFLFYSVYNCALFYIPLVQVGQLRFRPDSNDFQYLEAVPNSVIPVQVQDVAFAVHALLATILTCVQCFMYERGSQRISRICAVLLALLWGVALVALIVAAVGTISWFIYVTLISYAKLVISIVKYIPQVILNYRRKSTEGFSIAAIFLDFTGGMCNEWSQLFGDFTKFGLGLQSIIFDVIFFVQRYGLYGQYSHMQESATSSTLAY
ncbi:LOW QUALITY PROTEIN: hypothetical protein M514_08558, partial [Trichuris suis]